MPEPDANCVWVFKHPDSSDSEDPAGKVYAQGDPVRLENVAFQKNLHSHEDRRSPITRQQEVTAFGGLGAGDSNDDWIIDTLSVTNGESIQVMLRHRRTGHFLHSHDQLLNPAPAPMAREVTGFPDQKDDNNWWYVEVIDRPPASLSKIALKFANEERHLSLDFETSTSMPKWSDPVRKWIEDEAAKWAWLANAGQSVPDAQRRAIAIAYAPFEAGFRQLRESLQNVLNSQDANTIAAAVESFRGAVDALYGKSGRILYSGEPAGIFVCTMGTSFPRKAAAATAYLLKANPVITNAEDVIGIIAADDFLEGRHKETIQALV